MQQVPSVRTSCRALVPCGQQLHVAGVSCSERAGQPRSTLKGVLMKQGAPVHVLILGYSALGMWHVRAFQIASTCPHPLPGHLHFNSWACACLAAALEAWPYSLTLLHAHVPTPNRYAVRPTSHFLSTLCKHLLAGFRRVSFTKKLPHTTASGYASIAPSACRCLPVLQRC